MKTLLWVLAGAAVVGVVIFFVMKKNGNKSPVIVSQVPSKQTSAQKASEWIGVSGSAVDAIKNISSIFSRGTAASQAT